MKSLDIVQGGLEVRCQGSGCRRLLMVLRSETMARNDGLTIDVKCSKHACGQMNSVRIERELVFVRRKENLVAASEV